MAITVDLKTLPIVMDELSIAKDLIANLKRINVLYEGQLTIKDDKIDLLQSQLKIANEQLQLANEQGELINKQLRREKWKKIGIGTIGAGVIALLVFN